MALISPFIPLAPQPLTNFGVGLRNACSRFNDKDLLEWAKEIDWEEPVVMVKRFSSAEAYHHVDITVLSPLEVLVLSGNERAIKLLLTPERLTECGKRFQHNALRTNGYHDVSIASGIINAAIRTGSVEIVDYISNMALENTPHMVFQWSSQMMYTPIVCLSEQRHLSSETLGQMWDCMERNAIKHGAGLHSLNHEHAQAVLKGLRLGLLHDAARMGNPALVETMERVLKKPVSQEQWSDVLDWGHFEWAIDLVSNRKKWGDASKKTGEKDNPSVVKELATALHKQRLSIKDSFKKDPNKKDYLKINSGNFLKFMQALQSCVGGNALLSASLDDFSELAGKELVGWHPAKAAAFLAKMKAPIAVEEALVWLELIQKKPSYLNNLRARMEGCANVARPDKRWVEEVQNNALVWLENSNEETGEALIALSTKLGFNNISVNLRNELKDESSEIVKAISQTEALILSKASSSPSKQGRSRRL